MTKNSSQEKVIIPPIKCQGIKTKIVPFIKEKVKISPTGFWIEPFVGSGVVAFNIAPQRALLIDKNKYIISFYQGIQNKTITSDVVKNFLEFHGNELRKYGDKYYKKMREEFNNNGDPLYFLFLNRAAFNGIIRFNKQEKFNVPFCKKPNRFVKSYITKICNQVSKVASIMEGKEWVFECSSWQNAFENASENDYIYLDPPYIGRDTSYVGEWSEDEAILLAEYAHKTPSNVCLSMRKENEFRKNEYLFKYWSDFIRYEKRHYYYIGGKESNRHPIIEVLAIKNE